jgi:peptidyl-prolyl cis-trans isomerase A (cyclophilin A)
MRITIWTFIIILTLFYDSFGQSERQKDVIIIKTELGDIYARLDLRKAPLTSLNFLRYVDCNMFDSACFYRVVRLDNQFRDSIKIEVIQGGRYENEDKGFPPIIHETTKMTGIRHKNGTISMARNEPGSATSEFFICLGDQPDLDFGGKRNPDGQGFAAFGKIIKGIDVVRKIHSINPSGQYLQKPVLILEIVRAGKQTKNQLREKEN